MEQEPSSAEESHSQRARKVLRDLSWAVKGPALCGVLPPLYEQWLVRSDELWTRLAEDPKALPEELCRQRRTPIGRYFERLIAHWMRQQSEVCDLHENLPIQGPSGTLGEFDIVFCAQGRAYHWELAVKLYLGVGDRRQTCHWHGPMGRDRLDRKLDKLDSHQLRLPSTPEGRALLAELGIASVSSHALVKGYLFHPFEEWRADDRIVPRVVNPGHGHGFWLTQADAGRLETLNVAGWQFLDKRAWLGPASGEDRIEPSALQESLEAYFATNQRPPLLAAIERDGSEIHRGFVVPDGWRDRLERA